MNDDAFEQAVLMYKDRANSYANLILRDTGEAQDVAQEALVRLWQHRNGIDERGAKVWLMRTVHNLSIDLIRKRKTRNEVTDAETVMERRPDEAPSPQKLTEAGELGRAIERALSALSPEDRAVVVMREVQGMPYDEIAAALDVPLGTLKARLHRARDRMRARLTRAGVRPCENRANAC